MSGGEQMLFSNGPEVLGVIGWFTRVLRIGIIISQTYPVSGKIYIMSLPNLVLWSCKLLVYMSK